MNKKVKRKWLKALRSGEYVQGTGVLVNKNDKFCCLGVLCNIAIEEGVIKPWAKVPHPGGRGRVLWVPDDGWGGANAAFALPAKVAEWAGLTSVDPSIQNGPLSFHNDNEKSFKVIADLIEKHL